MSKQPEALRLAELFIDEEQGYWLDGFRRETYLLAADELRRQHALIAELLEALTMAYRWMPVYPSAADGILGGRESHAKAAKMISAAIAKARGDE